MQTETATKEAFAIPTFSIANTRPEDMREEDFKEWLLCIPEEKREEWKARRADVIFNSQPAPDAVIIDMRHCAFVLSLYERVQDPNDSRTMITGKKYAETIITGAENPKPKKNAKKQILFALPIINIL